ncbi:MAG: hypothetical protein EKK41_13765 [Hyphomicrobiales bacterium]|nr:MAG: hypothetical protein EKK41_13765 [Hyphomicrobiales bacterium]
MSAQNTPTTNEFGLRSASRRHSRRIGLHQGLGASPLSRDLHGGDGSEDPRVNRQARERIINFHISNINAIRRAKGMPELSPGDHARIHAAAEHSSGASSESIMQAVLAAANAAAPQDAQTLLRQQLAEKGIDEASYFAALAKHGATLGSFEALIAAAQRMRNGGSGADIERASTSSGYSGNIAGIGMANYMTAGAQFAATGMAYGTFNYLRSHTLPDGSRFSGANILHAGQDTQRHGLDTNDRRVVRNFAIVDRYDGARRQERNQLLSDLAARVASDPTAQRLKREYEAAGTEAEKKRIAAEAMAHGRRIQNESGYSAFVQRGPEAAKKAGTEIGDDIFAKRMGIHARHRADLSASPTGAAPSTAPSGGRPSTATPTTLAPSAAPVVAANQKLSSIVQPDARVTLPLAAQADKVIAAAARRTEEQSAAATDDAFGLPAQATTRQADAGNLPAAADKPKEPSKAATVEPPKEPVKTAAATPPAAAQTGAKQAPAVKAAAPKMNT